MNLRSVATIAVSSAASFLLIGIPYWQIPYSQVSLPGTLYGFGLYVLIALSALSRVVAKAHWLITTIAIGMAVPAAVMARVISDTSADPTSHNLWPIEIVIAGAVGFAASLVGVLLGSLLKMVFCKRAETAR